MAEHESRPPRPDEAAFKVEVDQQRKKVDAANTRVKEAHTRINEARPENQDNSATSRQQTIKAELKQLREQQDDGKKQRLVIQDKIKALDTQFKSKLAEQKAGKAQIPYKSVEDIDKEIARLDAQVESAKLKLVDEKKALTDISALRKQRKVLSALDSQNGELTKIKASISEAKTQLDTPERRAQNAQYEAKSKELEAATSSQRDQYKVLNEARDALKEAKSSQDQEWQVLKAMQDDYYKQKRAHHEHEREAAKQREARKKSEREVYSRVKRQERLTQKLEEAALPAYGDEIRAADTLLRMLDSNAVPVKSISTPSELAAKAQRTVDDSAFKGTKLLKRTEDEETYFMGTGPKKGKKSKKTRTAADEPRDAPSETKDFGRFWNPSVLEQFAVLSMDPPSTQDQAIKTLDQVMEKKKFFLSDRGRKTKENLENAQKEFDQLEAGEANTTSASGSKESGKANGDTRVVQEVTAEVQTSNGTAESKEVTAEAPAAVEA